MVLKKEETNETGLVGYTLAISERKVKYDLQNKESISQAGKLGIRYMR